MDIPGLVYRRFKAHAKSEGSSVRELILRGVGQALKEPRRGRRRRVKLPLVPSKEPGTLELDNAKINEAISFP
jgi:hypothetical protein